MKSECSDTALNDIASHYLAMAEMAFFSKSGAAAPESDAFADGYERAYYNAYVRLQRFIDKTRE
jgi:hypothetical protein